MPSHTPSRLYTYDYQLTGVYTEPDYYCLNVVRSSPPRVGVGVGVPILPAPPTFAGRRKPFLGFNRGLQQPDERLELNKSSTGMYDLQREPLAAHDLAAPHDSVLGSLAFISKTPACDICFDGMGRF